MLLAALSCGFAKAGIATLGIFNVMLLAQAFPAKEAVGMLLPMLIAADIAAVLFYRRRVVWKHLISLFPWVLTGLALGYCLLYFVVDSQIRSILGVLLLALIGFQLLKERFGEVFDRFLPQSIWFTSVMGILAGFATMIGNVSGVVMSIFLIGKKLPKELVVGTGAWFYLTINLIKVPFYLHLGMISTSSLTSNILAVPVIVIGTIVGVKVVPLLRQSVFQNIVLLVGALGALLLLMSV